MGGYITISLMTMEPHDCKGIIADLPWRADRPTLYQVGDRCRATYRVTRNFPEWLIGYAIDVDYFTNVKWERLKPGPNFLMLDGLRY